MKAVFLLLLSLPVLLATERPNILWITSEDNDSQWIGCYGNPQAATPNLDALAEKSVRFTSFYSNSPVCAAARSTILTGVHAASQGTHNMRSRHAVPIANRPYVKYLRELGYYCTNAYKTDYNMEGDDRALWDDCSQKAHYKNRAQGQPFFAVFNLGMSHESSLFVEKIKARRDSGELPATTRLDPSTVELPPYLPDLPDIRSDFAIYHDSITLMDSQVGLLLAELERQGLTENTLIFYYADHGGILPRGKRYLKDTGVRVPLIVSVPRDLQSLSPFEPGSVISESAAFVDLAPTLLSLVGLEKPAQMQGRAFLGKHREAPDRNDFVFLYADRFDSLYGMRRGLTDGRWKYIRRFMPRDPAAPYSFYQFGQAGWRAWQAAWQEGTLPDRYNRLWETNQAVEELYDTESDRWETSNLADAPAHREQLAKMRLALKSKMVEVRDIGLIPEASYQQLSPEAPIMDFATGNAERWPEIVEVAFAASSRDKSMLPSLREKLTSNDPLIRYWATQGCLNLGMDAKEASQDLRELLSDPLTSNRVSAACALYATGEQESALSALNAELLKGEDDYELLLILNAFYRLGATNQISPEWLQKERKVKDGEDYVSRLVEVILQARNEGM